MAVSIAATAQDGAPLYITGNYEACYWDPVTPQTFDWTGYAYTADIKGVGSFLISTQAGDWGTFYDGALSATFYSKFSEVSAPLERGIMNINCPWVGDWQIQVAADLSVIFMRTTTPMPEGYTPVFLRGSMNNWGDDPGFGDTNGDGVIDDNDGGEWRFTTADGDVYTLGPVVLGDATFKVADTSWSSINYGKYPNTLISVDKTNSVIYNGLDMFIDYGELSSETPVQLIFTLSACTLEVKSEQASLKLATDDSAPATYYDLRGLETKAPSHGIFIKRQGSAVTKVVVD